MSFYRHNDKYYIIHRQVRIDHLANKEGKVDLDLVKEGRDSIFKVDHVLRNETHFLFVETIQDAEIIEDHQELVEEAHSGHSA